jgi:hypothetical protein
LDMAKGVFVEKNHRPTMQEIISVVGSKRSLWDDLSQFISANYGMQGDLAFYGKNYGWAVRYRKGGKALVSMYPGKDAVTVQIVLGQAEAKKVSGVDLGANVRRVLDEAHNFPEGRWLFININSDKDLDDVKRLILIKSPKKTSR